MSQNVLLQTAGLHTFKNYLSSNPPGALEEALNIVIDRDNIAEPRRGFFQFGNTFGITTDRAKQQFSYKDRILRHYNSILQFDSTGSGVFTNFSGTYDEISPGRRMKGIEVNSNFYITTSEGIKKISAATAAGLSGVTIIDAGGPKGLDVQLTPNYTQEGFLSPYGKVAYRVVWGYTDANENLILGAPSQRAIVQNNDAVNSCVVDLEFAIPADVTSTSYFYQIYRTAVTTASSIELLDALDPGDEQYLVIEDFVTVAQLAASQVTLTDVTPDDFRANGALLYTNPVSGDGIEQANDKPPFAEDICLFKGTTFYANTKTRHRLTFSLLSVLDLISGTSQFYITDGTTTSTYTFRGTIETYTADFTTITFPGGKATLDGKYFTIIAANDERTYKVWFDNTGTTVEPVVAGTIPIKVDITVTADTAAAVATATTSAINTGTNDFNIINNLAGLLTIKTANNGNINGTVIDNIPTFTITQDNLGTGEDAATQKVFLPRVPGPGENGPSVAQQVDQAAQSIVRIINANPADIVYAYYLSSFNDIPGQILFESRATVSEPFYISANSSLTGNEFNPSLSVQKNTTIATGAGTVTITSAAHGYSNGDTVVLYNSTSTPALAGTYVISNVTLNTFDISATVTIAGSGNVALADVSSDNEVKGNRVYYSKFQQPEAVPLVNYFDIGPQDKRIQRIIPLREAVYVFKEEGIYRVTGDGAQTVTNPFVVVPFDNSLSMTAPDTGCVLNNQIYCLSTQGAIRVTDAGVEVVSRSIEDKLLNVSRPGYAYKTASFGVGYESDRAFMLWTVTLQSDVVATQCFRYNTFTQTWTRWDKSATCGIVNFIDDKLYLGAGDGNFTDIERKNLDKTDKCDRQYDTAIVSDGVDSDVLSLASVVNADEGDLVRQIQYLTISQFNRLLKRLDVDPGVSDQDYFSTLGVLPGADLRDAVNTLAVKLDNDPGVNDTTFFASLNGANTFPVIQSDFNIIITKLNNDTSVFYSDYDMSVGTIPYEGIIVLVDTPDNQVMLSYPSPYVEGPVIIFKAFQTRIIWTYQPMGDPTLFKQVHQGTIIFEDNNFTSAQVAYSSDLSPGFQQISFNGYGSGDWGQFNWGEQFWGGLSSAKPLRTLVPRQKQRCRYIGVRFTHKNAQENFSLYGISLSVRPYGDRAYNKG